MIDLAAARRLAVLLVGCSVLVGLARCSKELPSTVPLGVGDDPGQDVWTLGDAGKRDAAKVAVADAAAAPATPAPTATAQTEPADGGEAESSSAAVEGDAASSAPESGAAIVYAGDYTGSDSSIFRLGPAPERTEKDPKARTKVEEYSDGTLGITFIDSSNGNPICTLSAKPKGKHAKITPGQQCFGGGSVSGKVRVGVAEFDGNRLVVDLTADLEVQLGAQRMTGELVYHFDGTRP